MRPRGRTENRRAAFEQFVPRILEHDPGIELAAGMSYDPDGQLKSAAARYAKLHQEAVPEPALACAGVLSEPIRDRAARSGLHLRDEPVDPG